MLSFGLHRASYKSASFLSRTIRSVHLTLDLVLKRAVGLGQLANDDEDLAAISDLAELGLKHDLLTDQELVDWHVHLRRIKNEIPVLRPMNMVGGAFNQFPYFLLLLLGLGRQPLRFLAVPKHPRAPSRHACDSPL